MSLPSDRYTKSYPVSWEQLHRDSKTLARLLLDKGPFEGLLAITRGGLVPAAVIARELEIRLIDTICVASYAWQDQGESKVLKSVDGDGSGWLLIDDLVDSGKTARVVRDRLPGAHFAVVYAKPKGRPLVDTHVVDVDQDTWVLFPWDTESMFVEPMAAAKRDEDGK